jgi:ribonuclease R
MTHRLLFEYLHGDKSAPQDKYEEACKHSSAMEVKASDAERASIRYKQVEYIKDFVGTTFQGIISGMSEWGIYVEITKFKCEGMLRLTNINDDYYQYDNKNQWVVGQRTGRKFQFGDTLEVVVVSADIIKRQIDLSLLETETMKSFRSKWEKTKGKKSGASKNLSGGRRTRRNK